MEGQYHPTQHLCLACAGKTITWTFAICSDCEKVYGTNKDWPEWLRFSWRDELRRRRLIKSINDNNIVITYGYLEDVLGFVSDGKPFMFSNRNHERMINNEILLEWLDSLSSVQRVEIVMYMFGYKQEQISKITGQTRATVALHLSKLKELF